MHNSKIVQILRKLTKKELSSFNTYVASPFFNVNHSAIQLLSALMQHHPEYIQDEITREKVFSKLYPLKTFNFQKLRYAMTDLTKLLEDFLSYQEFQNNKVIRKHLLLRSLGEKNLYKYYEQHLNEAYAMQEEYPYRDINYYYNQELIEEDAHILTIARKHRAIDSSLQQVVDNIDYHYLSKKLKYACEIINRQNILSVEYELPFLEATIEFLKKNEIENVPVISIYFQILLTLKEPSEEEHYRKLKRLLRRHIAQFPQFELKDMYAFAQNYCIRQINLGNTGYLNELFDNYKILINNGIILEEKIFPQFDFKNIVTVALRLKEFDWTKNFILNNKGILKREFRKNAINYNMAMLHFSQQEYSNALKLLLAVEFTDVYYHLDSKVLLLKTYYEMEEIEPLISLIATFRTYLRRNRQISDYQRTIYNNLIKFVNKLIRVKLGSNKPLSEIKKEIADVKEIADITWLNSRVTELE